MRWVELKPASAERKIGNWYIDRFYRKIVAIIEEHGVLILTDLSDEREAPESLECEFWTCSAERTAFEARSIDTALLISVYHHLSDFEGFTREAWRILRPGGSLVVVKPIKRHPMTIFLNSLAPLVHRNNQNLSEPYGLALWINGKFIRQKLASGFRLRHQCKVDNFLWGINVWVPRWMLRTYDRIQGILRVENTEVFVFQKVS